MIQKHKKQDNNTTTTKFHRPQQQNQTRFGDRHLWNDQHVHDPTDHPIG